MISTPLDQGTRSAMVAELGGLTAQDLARILYDELNWEADEQAMDPLLVPPQPGALFLLHIRDVLITEVVQDRLPAADFAYQLGVTWQHTRPEQTVWQAFVDLEGYRHPNCMNLQLLTDDVREVLDDMADTLLLRLIEDLREKHLGYTGEEDDD
jgi:hypothetical protein